MTPYGAAARDYLEAGWSPIPLPINKKDPPPGPEPHSYTGGDGKYVTLAEVEAWTRKVKPARVRAGNLYYQAGNVALRLPPHVIGIDVDRYEGKAGTRTMSEAEKKWGPLPPTWVSTSRTDGSGIALYRIPEGLAWPGQVGPGVETLRWDHRYAIVAPSIHDKTGETYGWIRPDGKRVVDEIPSVEDIPELPKAWVDGLTSGRPWQAGPAAEAMSQQEVRDWLKARNITMCEAMRATLTRYTRDVRTAGEDGGAHERARDGAWALIGDAASGHGGVEEALTKLRKVFLAGVSERRDPGTARSEWARIVIRGVQKAQAEGAPETEDICTLLGSGGSGNDGGGKKPTGSTRGSSGMSDSAGKRSGSGAFEYTRDDIGNAQRLMARVGTDARWATGLGAWAVYDPSTSLWSIDPEHGPIRREMMAVVRGMETEAQFIEDPKAQSSFLAWVRASGSSGKVKAAIELAQGMKGAAVDAALFDSDPEILVCSNGTLELGRDGVEFRGTRHGDYATFSTGTEFKEKARHREWEEFVERVLPDADDCRWIQTLAGYSLLGANPERVLVIAKGPTTSGKTTFLEACMTALGEYAAVFNLSIFREKQDEAPRADVVEALPRRLIVASEASSEWVLHADAIKRYTDGGHVRARKLNSNIYVNRTPAFTPWLGTNSYPQVPGADKALWRRLKTAPFLVAIPDDEVDPHLLSRLRTPEARAAILAWLVEGWALYCRDALREPSSHALEMLLEAREEMSDLDACLAATCEFAAEHMDTAQRLFDAYKIWMSTNGDERRMLSLQAWGRSMSGKGFERFRARPEGEGDTGNKVWCRRGLRLKSEWAKLG